MQARCFLAISRCSGVAVPPGHGALLRRQAQVQDLLHQKRLTGSHGEKELHDPGPVFGLFLDVLLHAALVVLAHPAEGVALLEEPWRAVRWVSGRSRPIRIRRSLSALRRILGSEIGGTVEHGLIVRASGRISLHDIEHQSRVFGRAARRSIKLRRGRRFRFRAGPTIAGSAAAIGLLTAVTFLIR